MSVQDKEQRDNILRSTLNWFNDFFGTGLEELDSGEINKPASCVLAMTLNNKINSNFNWRVNGEDISIQSNQSFNYGGFRVRDTYNEKYQQWGVPVTIGNGYVYDIVTKEPRDIEQGEEYILVNAEEKVIELPKDVQQFIQWFDLGHYTELTIHNSNEPDGSCDCIICRDKY